MQWFGFTGDVMLGRMVDERQSEREPADVWGDTLGHLEALDGLFVNLECCLSERGTPWTRTHRQFHFRADPETATASLAAAGVTWANLANDHQLDYGEVALGDTLDALDDAGIAHSGAGETAAAAWEPAVVSVGETTVAFVSATDTVPEYAAETGDTDGPGVAYARLNPDHDDQRERVGRAVERAREHDPDLLVASLHWGRNMVVDPPEKHERFGRWLAEQGVDLVHGHSATLVQGVEVHDGTPICYDTGSFVDDFAAGTGLRNDLSFLFVFGVDGGEIERIELHPVRVDDCAVRRASGQAAQQVRETVQERSSSYGTRFEHDGEALVCDVDG